MSYGQKLDVVIGPNGQPEYYFQGQRYEAYQDVTANYNPVTGRISLSAGSVGDVLAYSGLTNTILTPADFSGLSSFMPTRIGLHRITINSQTVLANLITDCSNLIAVQDGRQVPCEVAPWSAKATSATVFIRTKSLSTVYLGTSVAHGSANYGSSYYQGFPIPTTATTFSCSHSAAGGSNPITSMTHPSLVDCGGTWNGARYWATVTPWSGTGWPAADRYEDPCLFNSADAATWAAVNVNASGYANIDSAYVASSAVYAGSDARLVYDPSGNSGAGVLYCYTRRYGSGSPTEAILRCQSTNGTTWTNAAGSTGAFDVIGLNGAASFALAGSLSTLTNIMSPSVVLVNGVWHMWGHQQLSDGKIRVRKFLSFDGLNFTGGDQLSVWWPANYWGPWHSDVQWDTDNAQFVMAHILNHVGESNSVGSAGMFISTSPDGVNWAMQDAPVGWNGQEDSATATRFSYKPCLCRVGARSWIFGYSGSLVTDSTMRVTLTTAQSVDFRVKNPVRPVTAAFIGKGARFFGDVASPAQYGMLQLDPPWKQISVNTSVLITGDALKCIRVGGSSGQAKCGQKLGATYVLEAYLAIVSSTSRFILCPESGQSACAQYHWSGGTELRAQSNDAGVNYSLPDNNYHLWKVTRDAGGVITIYVDGVQQHQYTTAENGVYGMLQLWGSGSVAGTDGVLCKAMYAYDAGCPAVTI